MPTIGILGKYKIKIYGRDHPPPHVHFESRDKVVRIDIQENAVMSIEGKPTRKEIRIMLGFVDEYRIELMEVWNEFQTKN